MDPRGVQSTCTAAVPILATIADQLSRSLAASARAPRDTAGSANALRTASFGPQSVRPFLQQFTIGYSLEVAAARLRRRE